MEEVQQANADFSRRFKSHPIEIRTKKRRLPTATELHAAKFIQYGLHHQKP